MYRNEITEKEFKQFLHRLWKFEVIWIRIDQIIRLQNVINYSETVWV